MERPFLFAFASLAVGMAVTGGVLAWFAQSPETVLVGLEGHHDVRVDGDRRAGCLDCHVPFVGTPPSRCLSPGCHGELATGTPPREGPAMPVRFHAALREQPCSLCHKEHGDQSKPAATFQHGTIPEPVNQACQRCHSGAKAKAHSVSDGIDCKLCHNSTKWTGTKVDHQQVWKHSCDICHVAPSNETHASIAGTCATCHEVQNWTPKVVPPSPDDAEPKP